MTNEAQRAATRMVIATRLERLVSDIDNLAGTVSVVRDKTPMGDPYKSDYRSIGRRLDQALTYLEKALERLNSDTPD